MTQIVLTVLHNTLHYLRLSLWNQGTTRGKEKIILTPVGSEPMTSGLDLPLLRRLSYEVGQRKSGTI